MPRYRYYCRNCDEHFTVFHSMSDKQEVCVQCSGNSIYKAITTPSFNITTKTNTKEKIGELTKRHIEESRKELQEQIKKAREEEYEPS